MHPATKCPQNGVKRSRCPRAAVFDANLQFARVWFGCSTLEQHKYGNRKIFKQHTAPRIPSRCGADIALTTLPSHLFNGVACRTFRLEIAARIRPFVTCVELRKTQTKGPNCVSELASQRSKHIRQLTSSASFLTTVQAIAEPHTLFEQRAKMIETATCSRNAKS